MTLSIATFLDDTYQSSDDVLKYLSDKTDGVDDEISTLLTNVYQDLRHTIDNCNNMIATNTKIRAASHSYYAMTSSNNIVLQRQQKDGDDFNSDAVPRILSINRTKPPSAAYTAQLRTPPSRGRQSVRSLASPSSQATSSAESTCSSSSSITTYSHVSTPTPAPAASRNKGSRSLRSFSISLAEEPPIITSPVVTGKPLVRAKWEPSGVERCLLPAVDEDEIFGTSPSLTFTFSPPSQVTDRVPSPHSNSVSNLCNHNRALQSPPPLHLQSSKKKGFKRGASIMLKKAGHSVSPQSQFHSSLPDNFQ
jgi:hypothetical protein